MPHEFPEVELEAIAADCEQSARDWFGEGKSAERAKVAEKWRVKAATIRQAIDALCLQKGHALTTCPDAQRMIAARSAESEPASDADGATQDRIHILRAALRGVLVDARRFGWVFTPETAALVANADSFD